MLKRDPGFLVESVFPPGGSIKIQNHFDDCSIGSYPYFNLAAKTGGVNIVVSSWNMTSVQPVVNDIVNMIKLNGGKSSIV